jgi:SAM-dependent methyltransferase
MADVQDIDVEQIMKQVQENIRRRRQEPTLAYQTEYASNGQVTADLASLHNDHNISSMNFTSHRRVLGPLIVSVKKTLRQLLTPILIKQASYNAANTRVTAHLMERLAALDEQQKQVQGQELPQQQQALVALEGRLGRLEGQQQALVALEGRLGRLEEQQQALAALQQQVSTISQPQEQALRIMRERVSRAERKLRRILHTLTNGQEGEAQGSVERQPLPCQALEPEFDYCGFEDHFRGDEEEIKERQRRYLEYFKGAEQVLDVGSGRGEFLELLRQVGIKAKGIDANLDMVLLCQEKGLDVIQGDALAYLESLFDASLDGIFAAQFIEHLPPNAIVSFVQLCHRKLKPNGIILLETPNPQCLTTMAWGFYLDFSHLWPCHPEAMRYLLESMRFRDVRLEFSAPVDAQASIPLVQDASLFGAETERFNRAAQRLNELIFGYQDYAVIGHRI